MHTRAQVSTQFRGSEVGPPLGVHSGNVEGDSLEPEHHEQSLGEGAVSNLGAITASLKSNRTPALGLADRVLTRLFAEPPVSPTYTATISKAPPELNFPLWAWIR